MDRVKLVFPYLLLGLIVGVVMLSNLSAGGSEERAALHGVIMCAPCGMGVDPATALSVEIRGRVHYFCGEGCRERFVEEQAADSVTARPAEDRLIDVVCHMEVNPVWGIRSQCAGKTYFFCTQRCRERFETSPAHYLAAKCVVCRTLLADRPTFTATYLGEQYALCSAEHRSRFKEDPAAYFMHTMWGIPQWLYYASIAIVLIVSFGVFDLRSRKGILQAVWPLSSRRRISRDRIGGQSACCRPIIGV